MYENTDDIWHILAWSDMTSSVTTNGLLNDVTQYFPLSSFIILSYDTKYFNSNDYGKLYKQGKTIQKLYK